MDVKDSSWNHYVNKKWKASMDVKCSTWNHYVNKEWKGSMDVNGASWTHDVNKEPLLFRGYKHFCLKCVCLLCKKKKKNLSHYSHLE